MLNPWNAIVLLAPAIVGGAALTTQTLASATAPIIDAAAQAAAEPAPARIVAAWEAMIGTWVTDNSRYKSKDDTMDAYGIRWTWGLNRKSLVGRLYGIKAGKEVGTFWEFREIWHPGDRTLVTMQFGSDGTYGVGPHTIEADGSSEMLQTFFHPEEGRVTRVGHRSRLEGDEHSTTSYDVDEKGDWKERRTYLWRRQRDAAGPR